MEAYKNKSLSRIIQCFSLFLILHLFEQLYIIPSFVNTKGVVACVGGFAILLFYIRYINKPLEEIGMIFSGHKVRKGLILAAIFNLISTVAVFGMEYYSFSSKPGYTVLTLYYNDIVNCPSSKGLLNFAEWTAICLAIAVINAFFYEMTFRGLLITLGSRTLHFWAINLIQAGLYTFWFLIKIIPLALSGMMNIKQLLIYFIVLLIYELLTALKLGLLRSSTGSVWACIFDHIAFAFILDMVHIQYTDAAQKMTIDERSELRIIAYAALSLAMVFVYYFFKQKKIREKQREHEMRMDQII